MVKPESIMSLHYLTTLSFKSSYCFYIVHGSFLSCDDLLVSKERHNYSLPAHSVFEKLMVCKVPPCRAAHRHST